MSVFETISPIDGSVYYSAEQHNEKQIEQALDAAKHAQLDWSKLSIAERATIVTKFVDEVVADKDDAAKEITWQMGRPLSQSPGEIAGFEERARFMIAIAKDALSPIRPAENEGFDRWIERTPLGAIAILSPWNYPFLTSVNALVPALMAGNTVILKHSFQTPLVAERYAKAANRAGFPAGVFQILHIDHDKTATMIADERIDGVFLTGSVAAGHAVQNTLRHRFIPCGLELGGKDPAYVRADADLDFTVGNLVDGAFFNSGQSCCGIERIYVHSAKYDSFVERFVDLSKQYKLGNPIEDGISLGPMVKVGAADFVRAQITAAIKSGAKSLVDESLFSASKVGTPYLSPHVLVDVDHSMDIMKVESFGPVVGIQKVSDDAEAIRLMNDSQYGLTASIWTEDIDAARKLGPSIQTGTLFLNRCDYLDPGLAWTGIKNSGRGVTLSSVGYEHVSKCKSYHFRVSR